LNTTKVCSIFRGLDPPIPPWLVAGEMFLNEDFSDGTLFLNQFQNIESSSSAMPTYLFTTWACWFREKAHLAQRLPAPIKSN